MFKRVRNAFQIAVAVIFVFRDLRFSTRRRTFNYFRVTVTFPFDRRRLTIRRRFGDHVMRRVIRPFCFIANRICFPRAITSRVIAIFGNVFVRVGNSYELVGAVIFIGRCRGDRSSRRPGDARYLPGAVEFLHRFGAIRFCDGRFWTRRIFPFPRPPQGIGLRSDIATRIFDRRGVTPTIRLRCHLVFAVVFELPSQTRFPRLGHAHQIARFIGIFDGVPHRIFYTFDLPFGVISKSDLTPRWIAHRAKLTFRVIFNGRRVAITIGFANQVPFTIKI